MPECDKQLEFEKRLTELDQKYKSQEYRINDLVDKQSELTRLTLSIEKIAIREESVENAVKEIKTDVKSLKEKPLKRWDNLLDKIIWLILGSAIAALFMQSGIQLK